jgi:lipopolysaccharide biosynthesis protein
MLRTIASYVRARIFGSVRERHQGGDPNAQSTKFAVYAHYDPHGIVHRFVAEQIRALADAGYRIVFVTHSPKLTGIEQLSSQCALVVRRHNLGHDFGAYKWGVFWIRSVTSSPSAVLLMNDSCYGFYGSIKDIDANVASGASDLWSFTESYQHGYHLQSYLLLVSQRLFQSPAFWSFWKRVPLSWSRERAIQNGEIGLTQCTLRAGFRAGAHVNYREAAANWMSRWRNRYADTTSEKAFVEWVENAVLLTTPLNPTHFFWESLLRDYGVPLIKRDLVGRNPMRVPGIQNVFLVVTELRGDPSAALDHLRFRLVRQGGAPCDLAAS